MSPEQQKAFTKVLDLVEEAGCISHVIVVGSWAEFLYKEAGILPGFQPNIKTMDIDFLIRNMKRPVPAANLSVLAREKGFFVESDRLDGTTKIFDMSGLEVEFLIGKRGAGRESSLKTNVGVTAQALWHMDILSRNLVELPYAGRLVLVPAPEAYVIHKMVVNGERRSKKEKDAFAVINLFPYLNRAKLEKIYGELTKKERSKADVFMAEHGLNL